MANYASYAQYGLGSNPSGSNRQGGSAPTAYQRLPSQKPKPQDTPATATATATATASNDSEMAPKLGATFVPGGFDDYYMPEVIAPAPQRVMPEVPQNMQDDLQRMELEAKSIDQQRKDTVDTTSPTSVYSAHPERDQSLSNAMSTTSRPPMQPTVPSPQHGHSLSQSSSYQAPSDNVSNPTAALYSTSFGKSGGPSFSPFPKVTGDQIPKTYEEQEDALWTSRAHVLHSNNVTLQLAWAKDALAWVEVMMDDQARELNGQPRPPTPKVEHDLRIESLNIMNYLASQEHPQALFIKSKWLEFGKFGNRLDKRDAYEGYRRAAELGYSRAEYRMGMLFETSNEMRSAIEHYNRGLALKDSAASYRLGMMSLMGQHGQIKDFQHGLQLIQSAADTADDDAPQGAYVYGMLIARELPDMNIPEGLLPLNLQVARKYIEKAAYLGFAKAQLKMGQAYELCQLGCDFNPSFSLHYYGLAAKQGQAEAALGVSRWFLFGYDGFFQKNEKLAFKYGKQAADAKLATGEFAMGYYHEIGIDVSKDLREAKKWYELAAEHGNKDAIGRLESLNQEKTLTKKDHETTTLGRIKSQHGSMRGKRPDRFNKLPAVLPAVLEAEKNPVSLPRLSPNPSPHASPRVSPNARPQDGVNMPDPSRLSINDSSNRPPAFTLNVSGNAGRPPPTQPSSAPYPDDDRPPPLNLGRPKSTAPYPEDDIIKPPLSPHFDPSIRASHGPQADRPMSAFGIRPPSPHSQGRQPSPGVRQSQSMANLGPNDVRPGGGGGGGRVPSAGWEPQGPGGYRQPGPGNNYQQDFARPATTQPYDGRQGGGGGGGGGGPAANNPGQNRLQKQNPNNPRPHSAIPGQYPGVPGPRDTPPPNQQFAPRTSSRPSLPSQQMNRPASEAYDRPPAHGRLPSAGRPERFDSLPPNKHPGSGGGAAGPRPIHLQDGPGPGRTGSAPPMQQPHQQQQRPDRKTTSPASAQSAPALSRPGAGQGQGQGQGPATFEAMGIPQGKNDNDCIVM